MIYSLSLLGLVALLPRRGILVPNVNENGSSNELDSFFPFDPYHLVESACYVEPLYEVWPHSRKKERRKRTSTWDGCDHVTFVGFSLDSLSP